MHVTAHMVLCSVADTWFPCDTCAALLTTLRPYKHACILLLLMYRRCQACIVVPLKLTGQGVCGVVDDW